MDFYNLFTQANKSSHIDIFLDGNFLPKEFKKHSMVILITVGFLS
ncbi:hypothetical protein [Chryseobacterium rhizosphaerae]|nr:hypothetical protein [Chryseobacterium rhizosphaerae]MDC8098665.1 hypothetical protein [Chryseobacterium rhizosphaerae]